ncbi:helix-turn-helix domain-containing protein [Weissella confusa]|uniref:helix-turn-helix domain-containing protein n=1 Tax=Weissella confusa TaxID=1583 RepID=UPI002A76321E|nr:helix-turn-helix domain-containing protein [Weissella confusa]MDY2512900.1 helix-turn-helix domain-containing protein [Weissella confusa]
MSVKEARRTLKRAYSDFQFHLDENEVSRKELAEVIGTSEQYVSRLVNGREDSKAAKEKLGAAVKIMDRFFRHRKVPLHRKIFKTQISA